MQKLKTLWKFALLVALAFHANMQAQEPRLHFVGIADTDAEGVGQHVQAALYKMSGAILGGMPKSRYAEHEALIGTKCEIETIMDTVRNLAITEGDTVVFYYAGHGAFNNRHGTLFLPHRNPGQGLKMRSIIEEVQNKNPRLVIMLADCCQTPIRAAPAPRVQNDFQTRGMITKVPALKQSLYFDSEPGTILLFATERNLPVPCGIPEGGMLRPGTLFSEAFEYTMGSANSGPLGWQEFGLRVKERVNETFAKHTRNAEGKLILSDNSSVDVPHQWVWAQWINTNGELTTIIEPRG